MQSPTRPNHRHSFPQQKLSKIRRAWNDFYSETPAATKEMLLQKATEIDLKYGQRFTPQVGQPSAEPATKPGFFRANAGALSVSAGLSALYGVGTAINNIGWDVALILLRKIDLA